MLEREVIEATKACENCACACVCVCGVGVIENYSSLLPLFSYACVEKCLLHVLQINLSY